jgi:hypothetical protein
MNVTLTRPVGLSTAANCGRTNFSPKAEPRFGGDEWKGPAVKMGVIAAVIAAGALVIGSLWNNVSSKVGDALNKSNTITAPQKK